MYTECGYTLLIFVCFSLLFFFISLYLVIVNPSKMMSNIGVGAQPSNSQSSNADQPFGVLEESIDDFSNWKTETEFKHILPRVSVCYNKTVKVDMVSDAIAWNITNLRKPLDWVIPTETVPPSDKVKSVIWIKVFKQYVIKYMKNRIKINYLQKFWSEKYRDLRSEPCAQMNWKDMCRILSPMTSELVRTCNCFILV